MRLKYFIEFDEIISDATFMEEEVLKKVTQEMRNHLKAYLSEGGFVIAGDVRIDFDLEDE